MIRWICLFVVVCVATGIYFAWLPAQIWYHRTALDRVYDAILSTPTSPTSDGFVGHGTQEQFEAGEYHKRRLVELGYFFHKQYKMEDVPDTAEAHNILWTLVNEQFPGRRYVTLGHLGNELIVWDVAESESDWAVFAAKYDVSDLFDRYAYRFGKAKLPARPITKSMVGRWGHEGEEVLSICIHDDQAVLSTPKNKVWRLEVHYAEIVGDAIHYVEKHYLHNGKYHPFNGVSCRCILQLQDDGSLKYSLQSDHQTGPSEYRLMRLDCIAD